MRRVVIGENESGKAVVCSDGKIPRVLCFDFDPQKRNILSEIWSTDATPEVAKNSDDPTVALTSLAPPPGGTRCRVMNLPPDVEMGALLQAGAEKDIDLWEEFHRQAPGFKEHMDNATGKHITDSVDYGVIISGQVDLEIDDGAEVHLQAGDTYVLNGAIHAWHNRYSEPCVWVVFMVGGTRTRSCG